MSHYFAYLRSILLTGNNFIISTKYLIRVSFSQTVRNWDYENLGNLSPPVPSNPPTLPHLSSTFYRRLRKNFYLYMLKKPFFFNFLLELRITCQLWFNVHWYHAYPIVLTTRKTIKISWRGETLGMRLKI